MFMIFRRVRFFYKKLHLERLRYALPFTVLVLYTVIGAYIFRYFELAEDEHRRARYRENTEYAFKRTLNRMLEVKCQEGLGPDDRTLQTRHVKEHLFWLMDYLNLTQVIEERSESSPWTWVGAMFYAGQLYTTIGYGLPATQTPGGRLASIVYIMVGIPLFLLILAEVGKLLSRGLRKLYKKMHKMKKLPEAARRMSEPMKAIYYLTAAMASTAIGPSATPIINGTPLSKAEQALREQSARIEANRKEEELKATKASNNGNERKSFPIPWALTILIVWIMFSAALFCVWETEWGYMTSIYFFFVSISTVGLGDLVPTKPDMMIINFFMILIGLALLSMCVNLIQEALEKLIERLIEQYIDEIEKIAAVVTNNEVNEFTEELEPFEVGMTEMLTVPVTTLGGNEHKVTTNIGRTVKDWFAERASNMLMNKIYPEEMDSSSESGESEDDEEEQAQELEEVVVIDREPVMLHGAAKVTVHRSSLVQQLERRSGDGTQLVPQISIHEGTPDTIHQVKMQRMEKEMKRVEHPRKAAIQEREMSSIGSIPTREGSKKKKGKKPPKIPKFYAGALLKYSATTMQAIQAIEYAKLRTGRSKDFKSRLFAKFATNQRFAQIVENNAPPPKHMVSSSIQTSPIQSPMKPGRRSWKLRRMGCAVESIDSTSSELNVTTTSRTNASCSANDLDSLYSNTYYDLCFGNYNTDSVPCLMAQLNTPQQQAKANNGNDAQPNLMVKRKLSEKLFGLFGRIIPGRQNNEVAEDGELNENEGEIKENEVKKLNERKKQRPIFQCHSTPSTPATSRRYLSDNVNAPSIPTTPLIQMTNPISEQLRLSLTPSPSPAEALIDYANLSNFNELRKKHPNSPMASPPTPIGLVPLHHRTFSTRRRFSASKCLSPPPRSNSLFGLNERRHLRLPLLITQKAEQLTNFNIEREDEESKAILPDNENANKLANTQNRIINEGEEGQKEENNCTEKQ